MNKKNKKLVFISVIVIIAIVCVIFLFKSRFENKVKKIMEGVIISKETGEVLEHVTVSINGDLINKQDSSVFQGEFSISNLEYTKTKDALLSYSVGYGEDGWNKRGILMHPTFIWKGGKLHPYHARAHWVEMDLEFSYLVLANYEEDGIYDDTGDMELIFNGTDIIVFPAYDTASALKILEEHQIDKDIFKKTSLIDNKLIEIP